MNWKDKYDYVSDFQEGRAIVVKNGKYGHVDKNGNVTTPIIYDLIDHFKEGRAEVGLDGKQGHVDKNGKVIEGHYDLIIGAFK